MQLLHNYPQDHLINVGNSTQLFWSHGKVCPIILTMKDSIDFIDSMAHILCNIYNIKDVFNVDDITQYIEENISLQQISEYIV